MLKYIRTFLRKSLSVKLRELLKSISHPSKKMKKILRNK